MHMFAHVLHGREQETFCCSKHGDAFGSLATSGAAHQGQRLLDRLHRKLDDLCHVRDLDAAERLDQPRQILLQQRVVQCLQGRGATFLQYPPSQLAIIKHEVVASRSLH